MGYPFRITSTLVYSKPWGNVDAQNSEWDQFDSTGDETLLSNYCRLY